MTILTTSSGRLIRTLAFALALCLCAAPGRAGDWPRVAVPPKAQVYPIGEQIAVNGLPMRIEGFVTRATVAETAAFYRSKLGKLVENHVGGKLVLGRAHDGYFTSIQLEAVAGAVPGTRGTIAVSNLRDAYERRDELKASNERLLQRLPSGSRLVSHMNSTDGGKLSLYLVAENGHSEELNRDNLVERMRADGYKLEREARRDAAAMRAGPPAAMGGRTLFFKGAGKEAMAVIRQGGQGRTTVVLNTINHMEQIK